MNQAMDEAFAVIAIVLAIMVVIAFIAALYAVAALISFITAVIVYRRHHKRALQRFREILIEEGASAPAESSIYTVFGDVGDGYSTGDVASDYIGHIVFGDLAGDDEAWVA